MALFNAETYYSACKVALPHFKVAMWQFSPLLKIPSHFKPVPHQGEALHPNFPTASAPASLSRHLAPDPASDTFPAPALAPATLSAPFHFPATADASLSVPAHTPFPATAPAPFLVPIAPQSLPLSLLSLQSGTSAAAPDGENLTSVIDPLPTPEGERLATEAGPAPEVSAALRLLPSAAAGQVSGWDQLNLLRTGYAVAE